MPKLTFKRNHSLSLDEAKIKVNALVDDFKSEYGRLLNSVKWAPDGLSASADGKGFTGRFAVDTRTVLVEIDLSFLATPLKPKIEQRVDARLDDTFGRA